MEIIRSKIFSQYPQIVFGMSTRQGGVSPGGLGMNLSFNVGDDKVNVIENRRRFFGSLHIGLDELAFPVQCHSNNVLPVKMWGGYENSDGLVTNDLGVFIVISVADCVPIFLFDPVTRTVAGVHSGWRGTSSGIVSKAIALMTSVYDVDPRDLVAFIGPAAGKCCYEVGEEVSSLFEREFVSTNGAAKWKIDLKSANRHQMLAGGIPENHIEVHESCTIHEPEKFHSHRRDGKFSGRMMGVIGIIR